MKGSGGVICLKKFGFWGSRPQQYMKHRVIRVFPEGWSFVSYILGTVVGDTQLIGLGSGGRRA